MTNDELEAEVTAELRDTLGADIIKLSEAAGLEAQDTRITYSTGYSELDACFKGGFKEGDVTVISAIPGEGKSTLARMFTLAFAEKGISSLWFSYEMSMTELWDSFVDMGANTDLISYVPDFLEGDLDWVFKHIDKAIAEKGIKAVFIDTLGDVEKSRERGVVENYSTVLKQICKHIRDYAVKNRIMVFEIAHCTKQTRSNTNETTNADIADSNGIAAMATNILHVWRDNNSDTGSFIKIGKSRRDGTKKNWKFRMQLVNNKLLMEGRHEDVQGESAWRAA